MTQPRDRQLRRAGRILRRLRYKTLNREKFLYQWALRRDIPVLRFSLLRPEWKRAHRAVVCTDSKIFGRASIIEIGERSTLVPPSRGRQIWNQYVPKTNIVVGLPLPSLVGHRFDMLDPEISHKEAELVSRCLRTWYNIMPYWDTVKAYAMVAEKHPVPVRTIGGLEHVITNDTGVQDILVRI